MPERGDAAALEKDHALDLDVVGHGDGEADVLKNRRHGIAREHESREENGGQEGREAEKPCL